MGIPLIQAIFEGDPNVGIYAVPLLIYHPTDPHFERFMFMCIKNIEN